MPGCSAAPPPVAPLPTHTPAVAALPLASLLTRTHTHTNAITPTDPPCPPEQVQDRPDLPPLEGWAGAPKLHLLNLAYDLMPAGGAPTFF